MANKVKSILAWCVIGGILAGSFSYVVIRAIQILVEMLNNPSITWV